MMENKAIVVAAGLCVASSAALADIGTNGGFEMGTGADSDAWSEFAGGAAGTVSERSDASPISGGWSHFILAVGDDSTGAGAGINQNTIADGGLASLEENTMVSFTFDAVTDFGPGGVGFLAIRVLNADGAIVADSGLQPMFDGSNASPAIMVPAFGGGADDTYAAFVEVVVNAGAFDGSFASAQIDNVVIDGTLVPAPASVALLAAGGLLAGRRRR